MRMVSRTFFFAWLVTLVTAQSSTVLFLYPPEATGTTPKVIINIFDTVIPQWSSNFKSTWLYLYCNLNTTGGTNRVVWFAEPSNSTGVQPYSPSFDTPKIDWDPIRPLECNFALNFENAIDRGFPGPPVQITSIKGKPSTTYALEYTTTFLSPSSSTSVTANTPSSTPASTSASQPISTSSPTSTSSSNSNGNDSNLSTGATAGIAVGVVVGVLALAGIAFLVWRNRRKQRKANVLEHRLPVGQADKYDKPPGVDVAPMYQDEEYSHNYVPAQQETLELDQNSPPSELAVNNMGAGRGPK